LQVQSVNNAASKVTLSDASFERIARFAKTEFGLNIQTNKKTLVYSRLIGRLKALNLNDFSDYCEVLEQKRSKEETNHVLSALTTNVTHFFREMHHFEYLENHVFPGLVARAQAGDCVRIWSAACSAGQEPFSIAAALLKHQPNITNLDVRILGTDIDPKMIAHAKSARYHAEQLSAIPKAFQKVILARSAEPGALKIAPDVQGMVTFSELNLMDAWPMRRDYDVIFCRNAAIYFDKPTQARLWLRFSEKIKNGGHLMIGHSERVNGDAVGLFKNVGTTTYRKQPA